MKKRIYNYKTLPINPDYHKEMKYIALNNDMDLLELGNLALGDFLKKIKKTPTHIISLKRAKELEASDRG